MWRTPSELSLTLPRRGGAERRRRRSRDRQRMRLVACLRSVARRAGTSARPRHFEVLLRNRAALVRPQLLEVAAALERVADPEPGTLQTLRSLLTDGCASPLLNAAVPSAELISALDRVSVQLEAREAVALGAPIAVWLAPGQVRGRR
jgi:hypothetical protein